MTVELIEQTIKECQEMASEEAFDLDKGHFKQVNPERYVVLLEELLRGALQHIDFIK